MLTPNEIISLVTVIAAVIVNTVETEDLSIIAAVLVQLGDTLATYSIQRERLN